MPRQPKLDVETQVRIVLDSFAGTPVSELCRRHGICPSHFYRLRDRFLEGGKAGLTVHRQEGERLRFENTIAELEQTIGKLAVENAVLKKTLR
jgi:transposase-like protein